MKARKLSLGLLASVAAVTFASSQASSQRRRRPNIVMLMTDDTGWNDFGAYSNGGAALGHRTRNVDQIAREGAVFTSWYGQASCTAGRASSVTGRIQPAPLCRSSSLRVTRTPSARKHRRSPSSSSKGYTTYSLANGI